MKKSRLILRAVAHLFIIISIIISVVWLFNQESTATEPLINTMTLLSAFILMFVEK